MAWDDATSAVPFGKYSKASLPCNPCPQWSWPPSKTRHALAGCGLPELIGERIRLPATVDGVCAFPAAEVMALMAGMAAGADSSR